MQGPGGCVYHECSSRADSLTGLVLCGSMHLICCSGRCCSTTAFAFDANTGAVSSSQITHVVAWHLYSKFLDFIKSFDWTLGTAKSSRES